MATSVDQGGSTVFGNVAATVVVRVDPGSGYAPDRGHPGFGTIVAVIDDPEGVVSGDWAPAVAAPASRRAPSLASRTTFSAPAATGGEHRNFIYTPELQLMAESKLTTAPHPAIYTEYVWFGGMPVAQQDVSGETRWTFTDHLGTPLLQTSAQQSIVWRAEHEPYGEVYALRAQDLHQPLRFPGQEAEQLNGGANGATGRSYNLYRWYEAALASYSQPDPVGLDYQWALLARRAPTLPILPVLQYTHPYAYVDSNPLGYVDPLGLHKEGGPWHPDRPFRCTPADTCPQLRTKISLISHAIASHRRWDLVRGVNRHEQDIQELIQAIERCKGIYDSKCKEPECKPCEIAKKYGPVALGLYVVYKAAELFFCPELVPVTP